jgi:aryl-alcohol dehydrogenase-like predicted oxidoreductase
MRHVQLGRCGIFVSELGLGAMTFGSGGDGFFGTIQTTPSEADRILGRSLEEGVNLIDTADVYGNGASETFLGRALEGRRHSVILATKVGSPMGPGRNERGHSRRYLLAACEASLKRLRTDFVDLLQLHVPDPATEPEESLGALDDLVRSGKVRYAGVSNVGAYALTKYLWVAERESLPRMASIQLQYSLLVRDIEDELLPMCAKEGVGVLTWSPLASGFLTGKYKQGQAPAPETRLGAWKSVGADIYARHAVERKWAVVREVERVAAEISASPSQVAIAWLLARPGVSSVVIGARTVEQVQDNLRAASTRLTPEAVSRLDALNAPIPRYPFGQMRQPD